MSSRRTMILIAAVAIGALAAFALFNYVGGIEDRANGNAERVPVLVVRADIPKGTPAEVAFEQGLIAEDKIAREFLPATKIDNGDQVQGKVALNNLAANQVLVDGMFVDPTAAQVGFGQRLEEDNVAITVSVDQVRGVAGLLVPGDTVNVFLTTDDSETPEAAEQGTFGGNARLLYHGVKILAVGQQAAPQPGENVEEGEAAAPTGSGLLTLDVPIDAAQLIASTEPGQLYLALTGADYTAKPIPRINANDLAEFPGESDRDTRFGQLTPYGPDGADGNQYALPGSPRH